MVAQETSDFSCLIVAVVDLALEVTADKQRALVVLAENIDLCIMEELSLVALDNLEALVLGWCPYSNGLIAAACQDVLASINLRELA